MAEINPMEEMKAIESEEVEDVNASNRVYKALLILAGIAFFGLVCILTVFK